MFADAVTLFLCLALLAGTRPATDAEAGYLSFDRDRAGAFWAAARSLGYTMPGERPWWDVRDPRTWPDPAWAYRTELDSLRCRVQAATKPKPAGAP